MKERLLINLERYLLGLARTILRQSKPTIIGITGSVGKTTTKEALSHLLHTAGIHFRQTQGNLNADMGIALTVLGYDHSPAFWEWPLALVWLHLNFLMMRCRITHFPAYFIVEMGIDRIGDMARMLQTIQPTVGVVTWIGEGHHLEFLKDPATIAHEKGLILCQLPKNGLAIIPALDDQSSKLKSLASAPVVAITEVGMEATPAIVRALGHYLKLSDTVIEEAIATFTLPKGRLGELAGLNNSIIIDDTYNSSLPSVKLALQVLSAHPGKRKIAVLGDILEQGAQEEHVHQTIADLAKKQADLLVGVGSRMSKVGSDHWFSSPDLAASSLAKLITTGDVILIKGSQGMRMEKIALALAADKKEAKAKLPRQNARWQQIAFKNP